MKKIFLLLISGLCLSSCATHANPADLSTALALSGVGLISASFFCAAQAGQQQLLCGQTQDRYQRRALMVSGNEWLKGAAIAGLAGIGMIQPKINYSSFPAVMGVSIAASSVLFAGAALLHQEEKNCQEEFERTLEMDVLAKQNHLRVASIAAFCMGVLLCLPLINQENEIIY